MQKILVAALVALLVTACSGENRLSPRVEPAGMKASTAPPAAAPPVTVSTAPVLPPSPPSSGTPTEPPKSAPGPAPITPQTAKQATQKNIEQAIESTANAVDAAKK